MGKGTDLWDDSALINAFDHAMSTYKSMHSKTYQGVSPEEEKLTSDTNEIGPAISDVATRLMEPEDSHNTASNHAAERCMPSYSTEAASEVLPIQENHLGVESCAPNSHLDSSGVPCMNGNFDGYSDQEIVEYNQLLRQYNELEEQRQKVLKQLHQASSWNYQTPVECSTSEGHQVPAYNASEHGPSPTCSLCFSHCLTAPVIPVQCSTCQGHQVPAYNASEDGPSPTCSLCFGHSLTAPLIPVPACAMGGLSSGGYGSCAPWSACCFGSQAHQSPGYTVDSTNQSKRADDDVFKTGMMAAERAISSMKMEITTDSKICEEKENEGENEKSQGTFEGQRSQNLSSETDLTVVLSAWYSAGFHTCRYLLEQSKKNANQ